MSPEKEVRAHDSRDSSIHVQTLTDGDFLVTVHSGPVSIWVTVPAAQVPFLFPAASSERAA